MKTEFDNSSNLASRSAELWRAFIEQAQQVTAEQWIALAVSLLLLMTA